MTESAHPEMDETPILSDEQASKYRAMIGSLNWIVTLGRIDVVEQPVYPYSRIAVPLGVGYLFVEAANDEVLAVRTFYHPDI